MAARLMHHNGKWEDQRKGKLLEGPNKESSKAVVVKMKRRLIEKADLSVLVDQLDVGVQ